jgi:adenine deaminase
VLGLAEMMNFPGAAHADDGVLDKIRLGLQHGVVDGHAPGLAGDLLQAYIAAGISSDHECTTADEAREKLALGQRIWIREGSAARNLEALLPAVTDDNFYRFGFCTDDRHPADLREQGHIDHIVRRAIKLGMRPERALTLASTFIAQHYNLRRLGAIAPGYQADLVVFDDAKAPRPSLVIQRGQVVARDGVYLPGRKLLTSVDTKAVRLGHTVNIPQGLSADDLRIPVQGAANIRVIGMDPHQLVTEHLTMPPSVEDGAYIADPSRDLLKLCVIERHTGSGRIGRGFVTGFEFKGGALASTVGHDAHNLAVVGDDDGDMVIAAKAVAQAGGGQAVVARGKVLEVLKLPIAGLMSDEPAEEVIAAQARLLYASHSLGCPHHDPFMPLSFLPLPVIPKLKLSDLGLVDVERFEVVPLLSDRG